MGFHGLSKPERIPSLFFVHGAECKPPIRLRSDKTMLFESIQCIDNGSAGHLQPFGQIIIYKLLTGHDFLVEDQQFDLAISFIAGGRFLFNCHKKYRYPADSRFETISNENASSRG